MALDFLLGDKLNIFTHDQYTATDNNVVIFNCPKKNRTIKAVLSGPLNISVNSQWTGLFSAMDSMGSNVIDTLDNIAQGVFGNTIRQPWFGRKFWQGTKPLAFRIPLQFVSFKSARAEVLDPMMGLLSLIYPRLDRKSDVSKMFSKYFIPGPTVFYSKMDNSNDEGDRVEIKLGNLLNFSGCYLTSMTFDIENSFNLDGIPHNVKASVQFETMDVSFVNYDGSFMTEGFADASIQMAGWVQQLKDVAKKALEGVSGAANDTFKAVTGSDFDTILNGQV